MNEKKNTAQYSRCLKCDKPLIKHRQKKFCSKECTQIYYRKDDERNRKISESLKKYFHSLSPEKRSSLYNTICRGKDHPSFKPIGSSYVKKHGGYKMIKISENKWSPEHIVVVEEYIGRKLKAGEVIHHINEDRLDNRPENLYLFYKRGLHTSFTQLVKHNIIDLSVLNSNLSNIKLTENGDVL
jgi:hypothetical protein